MNRDFVGVHCIVEMFRYADDSNLVFVMDKKSEDQVFTGHVSHHDLVEVMRTEGELLSLA